MKTPSEIFSLFLVVTKVVEDGAFTITSTIGLETKNSENKFEEAKLETKLSQMNLLKGPSPRFGAQMAIKQGILYLFGGLVEDSNDRQFTHKDLYALGNNFFPILSYNLKTEDAYSHGGLRTRELGQNGP